MAFKFISNEAARMDAILLICFLLHVECCVNLKEFFVSSSSTEIFMGASTRGHLLNYGSSGCMSPGVKGEDIVTFLVC